MDVINFVLYFIFILNLRKVFAYSVGEINLGFCLSQRNPRSIHVKSETESVPPQ